MDIATVTHDFVGNEFIGKGISRTASIASNPDESIKFNYKGSSVDTRGTGEITKAEVENPSRPPLCVTCDDKTTMLKIQIILKAALHVMIRLRSHRFQ